MINEGLSKSVTYYREFDKYFIYYREFDKYFPYYREFDRYFPRDLVIMLPLLDDLFNNLSFYVNLESINR